MLCEQARKNPELINEYKEEMMEHSQAMRNTWKEHNCHPGRMLLPFTQLPIHFAFFLGLQQVCGAGFCLQYLQQGAFVCRIRSEQRSRPASV